MAPLLCLVSSQTLLLSPLLSHYGHSALAGRVACWLSLSVTNPCAPLFLVQGVGRVPRPRPLSLAKQHFILADQRQTTLLFFSLCSWNWVPQAIWWRSQSVRFLLRHPTSYLCHLTNRARHQAYGRDVAEHIVTAQEAREAILEAKDKFLEPDEPERLKEECPAGGVPLELTDSWRFGGEAYVPRPIVSVHVRQGDKAKEMELYSFPSYMWLAERVRLLVPNLKFVWLSTEMQVRKQYDSQRNDVCALL